ncbi:hypothetical protein CKM354_000120400 [Cercospora kikuchii]|uniref:Hypervirulence associated protein TUDOR domain-containing protein n=1 Tax=Cercospora kikuchii TaxID=84275 RepID=A0A9P3CFK4_9PEZI|nr:uncharacterized protein CKM354_000120400 [Cercospora kikuchii]GIZ37768.1 hypothetical protein CKM354_000120400 [Cercospora kikuchii]
MADKEIKEGDSVSWQWSGSRPGGTVAEVKEQGKAEITTKNDNVVSKNAEPDNPAIVIERSGNNVVKKASEVDVEKPGDKHKEDQGEEKTVTENETNDKKDDGDKKENGEKQNGEKDEKKENGDAETGDKRKAEESAEDKKDEESADAKKQKTADDKKENGEAAPKKKGRPAKNGNSAPKKEPKPKKRAATESGEPRRSGRNASK